MRATFTLLAILFSFTAFADGAWQSAQLDIQLKSKGVAVLCVQNSDDYSLEGKADRLNSILLGLKTPVEVSAPAIATNASGTTNSVCVTLTKIK